MNQYKLVCWNMEWLNDLFDADGNIRPDNEKALHSNLSVGDKISRLKKIINELLPDILIIVEGPNKTLELQSFFERVGTGWRTYIQPSPGSSQCIGIAIQENTGKFGSPSFKPSDTTQVNAFSPFEVDVDDDEVVEKYKFERFPLIAEINTVDNKKINVMGLHLKSKGIFTAYEWSKWWTMADANRRKILAQASQIRRKYLDDYLENSATKDIPIIVCGDINDGPGMDAGEKRLFGSGIERLMGNVWHPDSCLKNALFEFNLNKKERDELRFEKINTTSFADPIFNNTYQKSWIDHILYSQNFHSSIVKSEVHIQLNEGKIWDAPYKHASDHYPISITFNL